MVSLALRAACEGSVPRSIRSSLIIWRWVSSCSVSSLSRVDLRKRLTIRAQNERMRFIGRLLRFRKKSRNGLRDTLPVVDLPGQLAAAGLSDLKVFCLAVVFR